MRLTRTRTAIVAATALAFGMVSPVATADDSSSNGSSIPAVEQASSAAENPAPGEETDPAGEGEDGEGKGTTPTQPKKGELSEECKAQVDAAVEKHKKNIQDGNGGSSIMLPQEFLNGLVNGYGSSGMPEQPDCVADELDEQQRKEIVDLMERWTPEFIWASSTPDETYDVLRIVWAVLGAVGVLINVYAGVAAAYPPALKPLEDFLRSVGFEF